MKQEEYAIEEAWIRQAEALDITVEEVKLYAALSASIQTFRRNEMKPTVILLPTGWSSETFTYLQGISVLYSLDVSKPILGFEVEL